MPTSIFAFFATVFLLIMIFYGKQIFIDKYILIFLFLGLGSLHTFSYRYGHAEGYLEGHEVGEKNGKQTIMSELGFKDDETLLSQLDATQETTKKTIK